MKIVRTMTALLILSSLSFSQVLKAEDVALPVIKAPAAIMEGTQRELTAEQIAELLPWAKNSKTFLTDLLDSIQGLTAQDKVDRLVAGIKTTISDSAQKNSELLMRYCLTRALVLNDIFSKEMNADEVGSADLKIKVLVKSISLAIAYYDADMALLSKNEKTSFVAFGMNYFNFLSDLNKSIFDASAQYYIQRTALEWLQWDLYRDLNNVSFAPQIVKINNSLKIFPTTKISDAQAINYIRQMKQVSNTLDLKGAIESAQAARLKAIREQEIAEEKQLQAERNARYPIKNGDLVLINLNGSKSSYARVVGVDGNGDYSVKNIMTNELMSNLDRSSLSVTTGCSEDKICIGETVVDLRDGDRFATVSGITLDQKYIVTFQKGEWENQRLGNLDYSDLGVTKGCGKKGLCVGDAVINTKVNEYAKIVGIQSDLKYVLKFTSGTLANQVGHNWDASQLIKK